MALTKINSSVIANNTIAVGNIADNSVDATKIASNSILTRHIDDNQIGIDQLNVSDGSNGQMLTTNGSGTLSFSTPSSFDADAAQVFNESGNDVDFRVESNNNADMLFVDGGNDNVLLGTQNQGHVRLNQQLGMAVTGNVYGGISMATHSSSAGGNRSLLDFNRSRNTTIGSHTVVNSGDSLGTIVGRGDDGDEFLDAASIDFEVDGTPGDGDMPGRIVFATTADGAGSVTERMRIDSSGKVGIGTASPGQTLSVDASGGANFFVSRTGQTGGLYIESDGTNGVIRNPASNPILFQTNGANTRASVTNDGITFNGDTAAANALDDYEEGTWTPALVTTGGVTTTSSSMYGIYTKIGNICHIHCKISATLSSLPGQTFSISGLPFAAKDSSDSNQRAIMTIGGDTLNTGGNVVGKAHFRTNGSQLDGVYLNSGTTAYWTYNTMDSTTFELNVHGFYTTT